MDSLISWSKDVSTPNIVAHHCNIGHLHECPFKVAGHYLPLFLTSLLRSSSEKSSATPTSHSKFWRALQKICTYSRAVWEDFEPGQLEVTARYLKSQRCSQQTLSNSQKQLLLTLPSALNTAGLDVKVARLELLFSSLDLCFRKLQTHVSFVSSYFFCTMWLSTFNEV